MDVRELLQANDPEGAYSLKSLMARMLRQRQQVRPTPHEYMHARQSQANAFGSNRPGYMEDVIEGAGQGSLPDYSKYAPIKRYSLAERLALAQQMPKESRRLALEATAPIMPRMPTGMGAFAEAALPMMKTGLEHAKVKQDLYEQEYQKNLAAQAEMDRKVNKTMVQIAMAQEKMRSDKEIAQQKMALELEKARIKATSKHLENMQKKSPEEIAAIKNYQKALLETPKGISGNLTEMFTGDIANKHHRSRYLLEAMQMGIPEMEAMRAYEAGVPLEELRQPKRFIKEAPIAQGTAVTADPLRSAFHEGLARVKGQQ